MNLLDYALVAILGYCLVRGIFRGLIKELSSIVGVLGGFYAAYSYYPVVAGQLGRWITNAGYLNTVSFLLLFTVVYLLISIAGGVIKYLMNIAFLGWLDRVFGLLFGALKGGLITAVVILALTTFLPSKAAVIEKSHVAQHTMRFSAFLVKVTPKEMKRSFSAKMKDMNSAWSRQ
jgi:membrane protein required for colicin V production